MAVRSKDCYLAVWNSNNRDDRLRFMIGCDRQPPPRRPPRRAPPHPTLAPHRISPLRSAPPHPSEKLKAVLQLDPSTVIEYKAFSRSLKDGSTFHNAQPFVFAQKEKPGRAATGAAAAAAGSSE